MKELDLMPTNRIIASNQYDYLIKDTKGMFNSDRIDTLETSYSYAKARLDIIYNLLKTDLIRESERQNDDWDDIK